MTTRWAGPTPKERAFRAKVIRVLRQRYKLRTDEAMKIVDEHVHYKNWWYVSKMHTPEQVALAVARRAAEQERAARAQERVASRAKATRNTRTGRYTRRR